MKKIIAIVGMPGAGKTESTEHLASKGIPFVRFGEITEDEVRKRSLPLTTDNERIIREAIRKEDGMGAYAVMAEGKISALLKDNDVIVIDGLYSWEEYTYLKEKFSGLTLINIYTEPKIRYKRLSQRNIRKVPVEDCYRRDVAELEKLNKGGPIAIADYSIENNSDDISDLHTKIDSLLKRLGISLSAARQAL
jgi:dephospho-CoA kinase